MRNPEATRSLIIRKAINLFNTKGYRATSLSDITKATGITKGAIYGHFDNKDGVAEASFKYATEFIIAQLSKVIRAAPTAPDKLRAMVQYYSDYIQQPPIHGGCPIINTSIEADDDHPRLRAQVIRFMAQVKDSLKKIVYRGIKEGQLKNNINVEEFSLLFYAAIEGAIIQSRIEGDNSTYNIISRRLLKEIEDITT